MKQIELMGFQRPAFHARDALVTLDDGPSTPDYVSVAIAAATYLGFVRLPEMIR